MTKDRDLKRLIRARMQKTGESYTSARAALLAKRDPPEARYADLAGMSDDAVRAKTGRTWSEWVRTLDAIDAVALPHREIARRLGNEHGLSGWWSQTVTVGYERIRGLRDVGQRRGGGYDVNKSKTFAVPVSELYRACADDRVRGAWMRGVSPAVRTATENRSIRLEWEDGTRVALSFTEKGESKSVVSIQHAGLPDRETADAVRGWWTERIDDLAAALGVG